MKLKKKEEFTLLASKIALLTLFPSVILTRWLDQPSLGNASNTLKNLLFMEQFMRPGSLTLYSGFKKRKGCPIHASFIFFTNYLLYNR